MIRGDRREQSWRLYESRLRNHIRPYLGADRLDHLTTGKLDDYRTRRAAEGAAPRSINAELTILSHLLTKAREWGLLAATHQPKVGWMRTDETEIRILSPEEEARLCLACKRNYIIVRYVLALHDANFKVFERRQVEDFRKRTLCEDCEVKIRQQVNRLIDKEMKHNKKIREKTLRKKRNK